MVVKVKEKFEKTRHVKKIDKSKKYNLGGEKNVRYNDRVLSNKKKTCNNNLLKSFTLYVDFIFI